MSEYHRLRNNVIREAKEFILSVWPKTSEFIGDMLVFLGPTETLTAIQHRDLEEFRSKCGQLHHRALSLSKAYRSMAVFNHDCQMSTVGLLHELPMEQLEANRSLLKDVSNFLRCVFSTKAAHMRSLQSEDRKNMQEYKNGVTSILSATEKMSALLGTWPEYLKAIAVNLKEIENNLILGVKWQQNCHSPQSARVHELVKQCMTVGRDFNGLSQYFQEKLEPEASVMEVQVNKRDRCAFLVCGD